MHRYAPETQRERWGDGGQPLLGETIGGVTVGDHADLMAKLCLGSGKVQHMTKQPAYRGAETMYNTHTAGLTGKRCVLVEGQQLDLVVESRKLGSLTVAGVFPNLI
jgi:hypothetical protein